MVDSTQEQFRIGAVIRQSLTLLRGNIRPFLTVYLIVNAPSSIYSLTLAGTPEVDTAPGVRILTLVETFVGIVVSAAVTYAVVHELRGRRVDFAEFVVRGLAQGGAAIKVALLSGILIFLGLLVVIVPGLVLYAMWWVVIPVAVIERPGTVASLRRSAALTQGFRWQVFALVVTYLALLVGLLVLVGVVAAVAVELFAGGDSVLLDWCLTLGIWAAISLGMAAQAVLVAVSYYHLRVAKEGVGIDEIAAVFD